MTFRETKFYEKEVVRKIGEVKEDMETNSVIKDVQACSNLPPQFVSNFMEGIIDSIAPTYRGLEILFHYFEQREKSCLVKHVIEDISVTYVHHYLGCSTVIEQYFNINGSGNKEIDSGSIEVIGDNQERVNEVMGELERELTKHIS
jgi:hypothetical protein